MDKHPAQPFLACDWAANRLQTATVVPKFVQALSRATRRRPTYDHQRPRRTDFAVAYAGPGGRHPKDGLGVGLDYRPTAGR